MLAHGAWADASIWSKVVFPLRKQGLNVMAVQLPLTTLRDDVAALQRSLTRITGPTILVGHSYTGAVVTEAATGNKLVKALVYVSAMAPDQGESAGGLFYREPPPSQGQRSSRISTASFGCRSKIFGLEWRPTQHQTRSR